MNNTKYLTDDTLNLFITDALTAIKSYPKGTVIRAKDLFDADFWVNNPAGVNIALGHTVANLVKQGLLPITRIIDKSNNHSQYVV